MTMFIALLASKKYVPKPGFGTYIKLIYILKLKATSAQYMQQVSE